MQRLGLGYHQLNRDEQLAYEILEQACKNHKRACDISKLRTKINIMDIMSTMLKDHPEIVYIQPSMIIKTRGLFSKQCNFTGCLNKAQAKLKEGQLQHALEDAVWIIDKHAKNDREILQGISEYLQEHVAYDFEASKHLLSNRRKDADSHNAYGALVNHKAVCDGFSAAYALIAQYFGIRCMVVSGNSSNDMLSQEAHAWNIVEYNSEFYHVDVTWDSNMHEVSNHYTYHYFGLDDDDISYDHNWNYHMTPSCNAHKLSYYTHNQLIAHDENQILSMVTSRLEQGEKVIHLKVNIGICIPSDHKKYFDTLFRNITRDIKLSGDISYMWNDRMRCLDFYII